MHFTVLRLRFLLLSHMPASDMKNKMMGQFLLFLRMLVSFPNSVMSLCDLEQIIERGKNL